ncbi:MAG TPA: AI-2E family transporter [Blastocatellia bacterium]|nr:AI-2E family transporter [Blastocatellia bacterium]
MTRDKTSTAPLHSPQSPTAPPARSPFWWLRWVPAVVLIILILELIYVIGRVVLIPILASFALAYLLNPLVTAGRKRGLSQPVATFLAMAVVTLAAILFLTFVIPDLWAELVESGKKVMNYFTAENAAQVRRQIRRLGPFLDRLIGARVEQFIRDPMAELGPPTQWAAGERLSGFLSTAAESLDLLLVPFFVYYILVDFRNWRDNLEDLIPPRFRDTFSRLFDEVGRILASYVRGQLLIAMIMAALYAVGFAALGVPAWAGIAALAGLLNAIPYVGTILGLILATGFTLAEGGGLWRIAGVVGVFAAVQSIEGYYLTPRILGGRLSLHPMAVFLGLLIGGKLFGILGVILAVPVIAVGKVFLKFLRELYKDSYFYHAGDVHPAELPGETIEERFADAADAVLAEQIEAETGEELLSPDRKEDDLLARQKK